MSRGHSRASELLPVVFRGLKASPHILYFFFFSFARYESVTEWLATAVQRENKSPPPTTTTTTTTTAVRKECFVCVRGTE